MSTPTNNSAWVGLADHRRGLLIALGAVLLISFDALLVRLAAADHWDIVFWRGWLICLTLGAWMLINRQCLALPMGRRARWLIAAAVIMLSGNVILFVLSVSHTAAANTVVILAAAPFFAALFSWIFLRERVALRTWVAIVAAMSGVFIVFSGALQGGTALGDGFAFLLAICVGGQLTILRNFPSLPRLPLICASGALAGLIAIPFAAPFSLDTQTYAVVAVMGIAQMPLATLMLTVATRYLPAPEVSLFLLLETVLAPIWVWWVLNEQVPALTFVGGGLIMVTVAIHAWLALREERG